MLVDVSFEITLASPLAVRSRREGRVVDALDHMPGSTLRGALAWAWQREFGDSPLFREIFLSGINSFPFLYPGGPQSLPYPLTAVSCKRHPRPSTADGHGVEDTLLLRAPSHVSLKTVDRTMKDAMQCPQCAADRKPIKGYREDLETYFAIPNRTYRMGVGIEEATGSASSGILYGLVALEPTVEATDDGDKDDAENNARKRLRVKGRKVEKPADNKASAVLGGIGRLKEEHFAELQKLCASDDEGGHLEDVPLFAGAARSRGFGQFSLQIERYTPPQDVAERASKYNYQHEGMFAITLASDAILVDPFLRNTTDLSSILPPELDGHVEILYQHSQIHKVSGWNVLTRLPKEDEVALQAGSVLLAKSTLPKEELVVHLQELENEGIGIRREEGFGRVLVCDYFHLPQAPQKQPKQKKNNPQKQKKRGKR